MKQLSKNKLAFILVIFSIASFESFGQTSMGIEGGITTYQDHVEDPGGVYHANKFSSGAFGLSISHQLGGWSVQPGLLVRNYIEGSSRSYSVNNQMYGSTQRSSSSASQLFLRVNYALAKIRKIEISPGIAYHIAFDQKSTQGTSSGRHGDGENTIFEYSRVHLGKGGYGIAELGLGANIELGGGVFISGFYRHAFMNRTRSGEAIYQLESQPESQVLFFSESHYSYVGLGLSVRILKKQKGGTSIAPGSSSTDEN